MKTGKIDNKESLLSLKLSLNLSGDVSETLDKISQIDDLDLAEFYDKYVSKLNKEQMEVTTLLAFSLCEYAIDNGLGEDNTWLGTVISDTCGDLNMFITAIKLKELGLSLHDLEIYENYVNYVGSRIPASDKVGSEIANYMIKTGKEVSNISYKDGALYFFGVKQLTVEKNDFKLFDIVNDEIMISTAIANIEIAYVLDYDSKIMRLRNELDEDDGDY